MFLERGFAFTHEAVRDWEARFARYCQGNWQAVQEGRVCDTGGMNEKAPAPTYKRHRFPSEIIGHAVWLYCRFALRYRDVEELLAERGVMLTYETVRQWCRKFGQQYANTLRKRRPRPGDKWHLDEVFVQINGAQQYRWRAVDQDGNVLDILVQSRRDKRAATKFLRQLLKGLQYVPRVVITDKLASYGAAKRAVLPSVEHRRHKGLNNRAENAHQPTRERERRMRRFTSGGHAQRFLAAYGPIIGHFRPRRHRLTASVYRATRQERFATWRVVTGTPAMA
jgi:putative transposase